ncbi:MAG: fused response regulator/phosphatase [Pseudomonadota bacterium]
MTVTKPLKTDATADPVPRPILVVDDSKAQRVLLTKTRARAGYATVEAASGEEALELCQTTEVELIISDWMMPGMSGVEFCRAYRAMQGDRPGYFILLTAQTEREVMVEGLESGADDFLSKPFHAVELKARIRAGERVVAAQKDILSKNALLSETLGELRALYDALDRDLVEARNFQEALVPERHHALPGGDVSFLFRPSGHVGGDLVGLFRITDTRYGVYAVDVSGHGVASALMTARVAGYLNPMSPEQNIALRLSEDGAAKMLPPSEVCRRLNTILLTEMETDTYLTMVLADVDFQTGSVILSQAGHTDPAVERADGSVTFLSSAGMPIGLVEAAEYEDFNVTLSTGDRLFLYSDGITECPLPGGAMLEEDGFAALLRSHSGHSGTVRLDRLVEDLSRRAMTDDFPDDVSCALIEMAGP